MDGSHAARLHVVEVVLLQCRRSNFDLLEVLRKFVKTMFTVHKLYSADACLIKSGSFVSAR